MDIEAGLINHLSLLVCDGLRLGVIENNLLPKWNVGIDPAGWRCRAIHICGTDKRLMAQVGSNGLVTTINSNAVKTIAEQLRNLPFQTIQSDHLEFPPHVRVIRIREGERITEAALFHEVFRHPVQSLSINDRYLRSNHHEARLRAYLQLIVAAPGIRPQIRIETLPAEINSSPQWYYYHTSQEQHQMLARLKKDFPSLDIHYQLVSQLPYDRFLHLHRTDGTSVRIGIGAGLDFIRYNGD